MLILAPKVCVLYINIIDSGFTLGFILKFRSVAGPIGRPHTCLYIMFDPTIMKFTLRNFCLRGVMRLTKLSVFSKPLPFSNKTEV